MIIYCILRLVGVSGCQKKAILSKVFQKKNVLDNSNLGGNLESFVGSGKSDVGLLLSVWTNKGVNLSDLSTVKGVEGVLDHGLVGGKSNQESQGVLVFHLLHVLVGRNW